jgi:hypothetical protein
VAAGNQPTDISVNNTLTSLSVALRNICDQIRMQSTPIQNMGSGGLETLGFSSGDAGAVLTFMGYMNTVAGVYYGTVQQGGSGGTGASEFDFDNALSQLWAGG